MNGEESKKRVVEMLLLERREVVLKIIELERKLKEIDDSVGCLIGEEREKRI